MKSIRRILVPTDFEMASEAALDFAIELAQRFDAEITVLFAYEPAIVAYPGAPFMPTYDANEPVVRAAQAALEAMHRRRAPSWSKMTFELSVGRPWRAILEYAEQANVDLIVMGTHGRQGMRHALLGSVAEKVVRTSPVPVLTVHESPPQARVVGQREAAPGGARA
jgi:nucleotide-binding universal stress UspA family protein